MRKFNVTVNGKTYAVEVEESESGASAPVVSSAPVAAAPAAKPTVPAGGTPVKSPAGGTVLSLSVANGATVKHGDTIAVIEAMKMETPIAAPAAGLVSFAVKQGDSVESGAVLAHIN